MSYSYKKKLFIQKMKLFIQKMKLFIQKMSYSYNKNELFIYYIYKK